MLNLYVFGEYCKHAWINRKKEKAVHNFYSVKFLRHIVYPYEWLKVNERDLVVGRAGVV